MFALMNDDCVLSHGMTWSYRMQNNQNTDQLDGDMSAILIASSFSSFTKHKMLFTQKKRTYIKYIT